MNSKIKVKYPIGIQWKLAKKQLRELRNSIDGNLESDAIDIPGTDAKYFITIFPNGDDDEKEKIYVYLELEFKGKQKIEAEFSISIESANFSETFQYVYKESTGWGETLCTVEELFDPKKRFIVNGTMIINVNGYLMIEKDAPVNLCNLNNNKNELCIILWNQPNKDFIIVAEGRKIHAHKCVLSGRSPVFEAMFKPHTKEAQEGKVVIPDFSFDVVETAIKFCYDSSLVKIVSFENQLSLFQFFDKYDIQLLKNQLGKYLTSQMDETNVCLLANCSLISNAPKLRLKCSVFLLECIKTTVVKDFDILDKDFAFDLLKKSMIFFSD